MEMTLKSWNTIIDEDFDTMREMLDNIQEKMKYHLVGEEKYEFIKPIKHIMFEAWNDLVIHGKPTFEYEEAE